MFLYPLEEKNVKNYTHRSVDRTVEKLPKKKNNHNNYGYYRVRRQWNQTISMCNENVDNFALIHIYIAAPGNLHGLSKCEYKALVVERTSELLFMLHFDSPFVRA